MFVLIKMFVLKMFVLKMFVLQMSHLSYKSPSGLISTAGFEKTRTNKEVFEVDPLLEGLEPIKYPLLTLL